MTTVMCRVAQVRIPLAAAFLLGVGLYAGCPPALADWQATRSGNRPPDPVTTTEQRYRFLVTSLPRRGVVGYLPPKNWPSVDAIRGFYLAQFALTPRLVVMGTDADFVIAVPEAQVEGGERAGEASRDKRLLNFALVARFDNGLSVFRRLK